MKKLNIGIFLSLLLMVGLCSCGEQKSNTKLVLNEVLIENESDYIVKTVTFCPKTLSPVPIFHNVTYCFGQL